ncbi:MAG: hypothetical protein Q9180_004014 [Flavoplaca navasiana]
MAILSFRKHSLRTRDDKRTPASELTLRQSIFPLCLSVVHLDIQRSASTSPKPSTPWVPSLLLCWVPTSS